MTSDSPRAPDNPRPPEDVPPEPGAAPDTAAGDPPPLFAFAWHHGLVRPTNGRLIAGVCGALGRATNTDPILWRVILAVLTVFGGIGVLAYLVGWLFLPSDTDTATPVEAVMGRGHSGTSTVLTILGVVVALLFLAAFVSEPFVPGLLGFVLLGVAMLLLLRDQHGRLRRANPFIAVPGPPSSPWSAPHHPAGPAEPGISDAPGGPSGPTGPPPPPASVPPAFARPAFAPPAFAPPTPPPMPVPPMVPPVPPKPKPPWSPLGWLTISVILVVVGVLAIVDLTAYPVPVGGYVAAALGTVALGLLVGAWFGRARSLVVLGVALTLVLAAVAGVDRIGQDWPRRGSMTWTPTSVGQLQDSYRQDVGDLRLDLTQVSFAETTAPVHLDVRLDVGNLVILLPPHVDVVTDANVDVGSLTVLNEHWTGLDLSSGSVRNDGIDGPGGGDLIISAQVDLGSLQIHR